MAKKRVEIETEDERINALEEKRGCFSPLLESTTVQFGTEEIEHVDPNHR